MSEKKISSSTGEIFTPQLEDHCFTAIQTILHHACFDDEEACAKTPRRWINAMKELTSGYTADPKLTLFTAKTNDLICKRRIKYYSLCKHHLLPFYGHAYIAYIPDKYILGLSKLSRIVEMFSKRFQIQEDLTFEIAWKIMNVLGTEDVMVILTGEHLCEKMRGAENDEPGSLMITSTTQGKFRENQALRAETMKLLEPIT